MKSMSPQKQELLNKAIELVFQPLPPSGLQRADFAIIIGGEDAKRDRQLWQFCDEIFWDLFSARIITPIAGTDCLSGRFCLHSDAQANRVKFEQALIQ
jgi:hypothetical protein